MTYTFDAANRITSSSRTVGSLTTAVNYKYDGDGRRVRMEVTGGASTSFVYDAGGKLLAEYNSQSYPESGTRFRIGDHLGSTRLLFDLSGNVLQRFDYLPFGEELLTSNRTTALKYGVASTVKQRFTGQMRDAETNLDYFNARYLSPHQGRFTSVDPGNAGASTGDPQSWNAYSYTINNPLLYVDSTGLAYHICAPNTPCVSLDFNKEQFEEWKKANPNLVFYHGSIYAQNDDGSATRLGTYRHYEAFTPLQLALVNGVRNAGPVAEPKYIAAFYGASALGGFALYQAGAYSGGQLITLNLAQTSAAAEATSASGSLVGVGLRRQIQLHRQKLQDYIRNPDAFDNKGFLKNASPQLRKKIIEARIRSLEGQIRTFESQLEKLIRGK